MPILSAYLTCLPLTEEQKGYLPGGLDQKLLATVQLAVHLHTVFKVNTLQQISAFAFSSDFIQFWCFRVKSVIQMSILFMADYFINFVFLIGEKNLDLK